MILRDYIVYCVSALSLHIESTSTNSMICNVASTTIHYHRFLSNKKFIDGPICIPSTLQHGIQLASFPVFALWFACIDNNTRNGRAGRPGRIHGVSDVRWMQVGCRGVRPIVDSASQSARLSASPLVETPDAVDNTAQPCLNLLAVGPHPLTVHSMLLTWWMVLGLSISHGSSASMYYCHTNQKAKNRVGLGTRLKY